MIHERLHAKIGKFIRGKYNCYKHTEHGVIEEDKLIYGVTAVLPEALTGVYCLGQPKEL